jgi:hypothetical protein
MPVLACFTGGVSFTYPAVLYGALLCCIVSCCAVACCAVLCCRIVYLPGLEEEDLLLEDIIRDGHMMLMPRR